jgi:hypothetical protein
MKKIRVMVTIVFAVLALAVVGLLAWANSESQRADNDWDPGITQPTFTGSPPRVVIDQAHHNAHTARGKYRPFARLLRADGFEVGAGRSAFTPGSLDRADVLVIVNASGAPKPQLYGINLPTFSKQQRDAPAFTPDEIEAVRAWVGGGGSLLLIADHAPFGAAASAMGEAFGVRMYRGFLEVPGLGDPTPFSRENGLLGEHAITAGTGPETRVSRVLTFTGQSLDGRAGAVSLLALPDSSIEWRVREGEEPVAGEAGSSQGVAFEYGRGRVVVLGEAAMLTAQIVGKERVGMSCEDCDNRQFALNVMHWLVRRL